MALDARAEGNWGCPPERYPEALALVDATGSSRLRRDDRRPSERVLADLQAHRIGRRVVLVPDGGDGDGAYDAAGRKAMRLRRARRARAGA
jgi:hypothetical protein